MRKKHATVKKVLNNKKNNHCDCVFLFCVKYPFTVVVIVSGPAFWGRLNSDWFMCTKGKNQSPIDIEPNILLFDPSLKHIVINGDSVSI